MALLDTERPDAAMVSARVLRIHKELSRPDVSQHQIDRWAHIIVALIYAVDTFVESLKSKTEKEAWEGQLIVLDCLIHRIRSDSRYTDQSRLESWIVKYRK